MAGLEALQSACHACTACPLAKTRTNVVFGVGPCPSPIVFVGEGPGQQEDLQGEPFVGPAGKLLDDMLSIIDLSRKNAYITNIVKCRPPQNRDPLPQEQDACIGFLNGQLRLLQPRMLVCLGRIAAMRLIHEDYRGARSMGLQGRPLAHRDLSPVGAAARRVQAAGDVLRPAFHPRQGARAWNYVNQ